MECVSSRCPAHAAFHQCHRRSRFQDLLQPPLWLVIALLLWALFAGCATTNPVFAPTAVPPTSSPTGMLPAFSDWRLAYLGQDGKLHVVTQDGKTVLAGPTIGSSILWDRVKIAPDGRALAYPGEMVNLRPGAADSQGVQDLQGADFYWSPDSTRLAFEVADSAQAQRTWETLALGSAAPTVIPGTQSLQGGPIGWIDTTHLAVSIPLGEPATSYTLSSLDMTTGALRKIASISADSLGLAAYSLSPDGSEILLTNHAGEGLGTYPPIVELIETKTGQKHRLPRITYNASSFDVIAWKPGTQLVLASYGDPSAGSNASGVLLDLGQDTVTRFAPGVFPLGWAPDTGALFVSTQTGTRTSSTSPVGFQVSTMAALPPATASQPVFSVSSINFPFIGFVRTA